VIKIPNLTTGGIEPDLETEPLRLLLRPIVNVAARRVSLLRRGQEQAQHSYYQYQETFPASFGPVILVERNHMKRIRFTSPLAAILITKPEIPWLDSFIIFIFEVPGERKFVARMLPFGSLSIEPGTLKTLSPHTPASLYSLIPDDIQQKISSADAERIISNAKGTDTIDLGLGNWIRTDHDGYLKAGPRHVIRLERDAYELSIEISPFLDPQQEIDAMNGIGYDQ
jgi:hypothetical protein